MSGPEEKPSVWGSFASHLLILWALVCLVYFATKNGCSVYCGPSTRFPLVVDGGAP